MSSSVFVDVVRLAFDVLSTDPQVANTVERNQLRAIPQDVGTAVVVRLGRSAAQLAEILGGTVDWRTAFVVECYARAATDQDVAEAVDPVLRAVYARLAENNTLSGAVMALQIASIEWEFGATAENLACAILNFTALHETAAHNLESPPQ